MVREYSDIADIIKESKSKIDESENVEDDSDENAEECIVRQFKPKKGIRES